MLLYLTLTLILFILVCVVFDAYEKTRDILLLPHHEGEPVSLILYVGGLSLQTITAEPDYFQYL